jgi:hypothetical protein
LVTLNDRIMENTNLQLYELNQTTLLKCLWSYLNITW